MPGKSPIWFRRQCKIFERMPPGTIVPVRELFPQSGARSPGSNRKRKPEVHVMLGWVVTFLIVALIAGILGFGGVAGASIEIAKIIFFIAVVLFVVSAVVGVARGRRI
jgi:uncharacterized membrane protein YtjA (UPF0391 family)